jgi:hypothetical protein
MGTASRSERSEADMRKRKRNIGEGNTNSKIYFDKGKVRITEGRKEFAGFHGSLIRETKLRSAGNP